MEFNRIYNDGEIVDKNGSLPPPVRSYAANLVLGDRTGLKRLPRS
jgi:hypothetical protein